MSNSAHLSLLPVAIGLVVIGGLLLAVHKGERRHKKHSKGWSAFGWALLFLTSGRMPPPPPESQIEQEHQARKNRSQSDDHDR
jgi:hypothetical protein